MLGGIEETAASFEARFAPRSYPTVSVLLHCMSQVVCRFSDAGMTAYRGTEAAGVRKAPRHEIADGNEGSAAGGMGILPRAQGRGL